MDPEQIALISPSVCIKYKRRWYILLLFSAVAVLQGKPSSPLWSQVRSYPVVHFKTKVGLWSVFPCWSLFHQGEKKYYLDTIWNTWGPIDHTAILLYGWNHELVALFANYGSILYIIGFLPMVWLLGYSLRLAMLVTSGFMAAGTILR